MADVRRRMHPPQRQNVARISEELGIHVMTLYKWRKTWRLQGEVVPASEKEPEGWSDAGKFTVVLESAGLNATELSAYSRERSLFPEQVSHWRQAALLVLRKSGMPSVRRERKANPRLAPAKGD